MSVIVVLSAGGGRATWVGADSMVHAGSLRFTAKKWVVRHPWAVGVAGHLRTVNLIEQHAGDLFRDLANPFEFSCRIRELLRQDGYNEAEERKGPVELGQSFLLAHAAGAWAIGADFSVVQVPAGQLWAEGTGRELALGAAYANLAMQPPLPESDIVRSAIEAAIAFDGDCGGPVWFETLSAERAAPAAATVLPHAKA